MRKTILFLLTAFVFLAPLILAPLTIDYYNPPKELFLQFAVILCAVLWLILGIRENRIDMVNTKFYFLLILCCAVFGISLLKAESAYLGLRDYSLFLSYMVIFFIVLNSVVRREVWGVATGALAGGFIAAGYALIQYFGYDFIKYPGVNFPDWRFRLYSTFGNPDFLADYIILIFPVGISIYVSAENLLQKFVYLFVLCTLYSALLITFSIGALAGIIISAITIACIYAIERSGVKNLICSERPIKHVGLSMAVLTLILALISGFLFTDNKYHPKGLFKKASASIVWRHGFKNRLNVYEAALRMSRDNPLRGVGIGNFKLRFPEYRAQMLNNKQQYIDSNILDKEKDINCLNEYLQALAETGLPGLISLVLIFIVIFKMGISMYFTILDKRRKYLILGLTGGIIAVMVHSLTSFPMHVAPNAFLFWVFVGLLFCQMPEEDRVSFQLNFSSFQKRFYEAVIITAGIALLVWPVKFYASDMFLKKMVDLDKKGLLERALGEAKKAVLFNPGSNAITYIANYAIINNDYETAAYALKKALENNNLINYHITLAQIYQKQNLPKDSMNEYLKALKLNPNYADMRIRLAELYTENKMYSEAEAQCQLLLISNPNNENIKQKLTGIMKKIFEDRFLSTYCSTLRIGNK